MHKMSINVGRLNASKYKVFRSYCTKCHNLTSYARTVISGPPYAVIDCVTPVTENWKERI